MKNSWIFAIFILMYISTTAIARAQTQASVTEFPNQSVCWILYDVSHFKFLSSNPHTQACQTRIHADSTFKIPLSLMAFNENLIQPNTIFKWDHLHRELSNWNQDQTPTTWLRYSVVWVSQQLTPKLGLKTIQKYLRQFQYGNQDFSGNLGKQDGLTQAWLTSSLKISGEEQFEFLRRLLALQLPIRSFAAHQTQDDLYLETSSQGNRLFGKTGSSIAFDAHDQVAVPGEGWFVGWVQKGKQKYIFVLNFQDKKEMKEKEYGLRAKKMALSLLKNQGLWE